MDPLMMVRERRSVAKSARREGTRDAVTSVPIFDERDRAWRWFAMNTLCVIGGRVMGVVHREDGPAIEWAGGTRMWLISGKYNREDGPAIEWAGGTRMWYVRDQCHRGGDLAIERVDGTREWWIRGERFRDEEAWRRARDAKRRTR